MKRISVHDLRPGTMLSEPIYTVDKQLLLSAGLPFTREMQDTLRDGAWKFVYIGEWNDADAALYSQATPIASFRSEAERMSDALLRKFQNDLSATLLTAPPTGQPLSELVNRGLRLRRPEQSKKDFRERRGNTSSVVERIVEGVVPPGQASSAAAASIDAVIADVCADPSLAANLLNLKGRGEYLYTHSVNRAVLSIHIATGLGYSRKQVMDIAISALVADLGMTMVPKELVDLNRRLTAPEYVEVQRHALYSLHATRKIPGLPAEAPFVAYQLHERYDGSGYPGKRKASAIHRYAAIAAVADSFDAMTSARPWRAAYSQYRAMETLIKEAAREKYDRDAVRALLQYLSLFPIGSLVRLSNGEVAKVIHATGRSYDRPVVAVLFDATGTKKAERVVIELDKRPDVKIEGVVEGSMGVSIDEGF